MIAPLSMDAWEAFDASTPAPTFFARPAFAKAYAQAVAGYEPHPIEVRLRGERYIVPALRSVARIGFTEISAFPLGGYGCVMDAGGRLADATDASAVLETIAHHVGQLEFTPWPLGPQPSIGGKTRAATTAVIDCAGGLESAMSAMRGVTRRMAGQALRRGITCELAPRTDAGADRYYEILQEASEHWGLEHPTISRELVRAVLRQGNGDAELWFALLDGEPVAGGLVLFGASELFFWSAAMRREFSQYRPSNALNVRLLERACERGVRWYNLGASEGLAGVERFKHDLGARDVEYRAIVSSANHYRMYLRVRAMIGALVPS